MATITTDEYGSQVEGANKRTRSILYARQLI